MYCLGLGRGKTQLEASPTYCNSCLGPLSSVFIESHWQFEWQEREDLYYRNQQMLQISPAFSLGVGNKDNQFLGG